MIVLRYLLAIHADNNSFLRIIAVTEWVGLRGLGRIWETGCVKNKTGCVIFLPRYARNSFTLILASFAAKKLFFSPFIKNWATLGYNLRKTSKKKS